MRILGRIKGVTTRDKAQCKVGQEGSSEQAVTDRMEIARARWRNLSRGPVWQENHT